ncbi:MAG: YraN family protein [Chloroflexi bacterium]|nr:MAG: YraN family protein [Chloroflexota bacterium]TME15654.1 MAG: YraN family protein [Chloroflexota bacterium]
MDPGPPAGRLAVLARQRLGEAGERLAAEHLRNLGYLIEQTNFRCRRGDIDLVCRRDGEVVMVEVKTRSGVSHGRAEEALGETKRRALVECATEYRRLTGWRGPIRHHAVAIHLEVLHDFFS